MTIVLSGTDGITTPTYGGADTSEYLVPVTAFKNRIINGAMMIDQRNAGASVTVNSGTNTFGVDRWKGQASGGGVYTQQRSAVAPAGFTNSVLLTVTTPDSSIASTDYYIWGQAIEGFNIADLGWGTANAQTVTISFWVRSSVTGTYALFLGNNGDNRSYVATYTINSANTFEYKTVTIAGDTSGTWSADNNIGIGLWFTLGAGLNFNATAGVWNASLEMNTSGSTQWIATNGATFYITGVQLEVGSTATSFDYRPYGTELQLCQRYAIVYGREQAYSEIGGTGMAVSTTSVDIGVTVPVQMRTVPTVSSSGNFQISDGAAATAATGVSIVSGQNNLLVVSLRGSVASGLTTYRPYRLETANSLTAYVLLSAEL